jgi:hypothetical protein
MSQIEVAILTGVSWIGGIMYIKFWPKDCTKQFGIQGAYSISYRDFHKEQREIENLQNKPIWKETNLEEAIEETINLLEYKQRKMKKCKCN